MSIFNSEKIIKVQSPHEKLKIYYAGFDFNEFMRDKLVEQILDVLVDFSYGFHKGILEKKYDRRILKEAARSLYKIDSFQKSKEKYIDEDDEFPDIADKYFKRGEFGELILHLLLRDFHDSVPLLSKIYFKDSRGHAVHGFDAVHIAPDINDNSKYSLWLGESKLYTDGKIGVKELTKDINEHFKKNYLRDEFTLISKTIDVGFYTLEQFQDLNKKEEYEEFLNLKDEWLDRIDEKEKLQDILSSVTVPMLCTYTSDTFNKFTDETSPEFLDALKEEVEEIEKYFYKHLSIPSPITNLNIILLLFPVPSKKELVQQLHIKVGNLQ